MAYSLDNGKTFKKYARNPILTSTQRDFRDPKVIWHEDTKKWIMVDVYKRQLLARADPKMGDGCSQGPGEENKVLYLS